VTTRQKIISLVDAARQLGAGDAPGDMAQLFELVQIVEGLGFDLVGMLLPPSDAETDVLIDKLIAVLLEVRGDDLPPFDPDRYGEALE
jgi:hypothetical protein